MKQGREQTLSGIRAMAKRMRRHIFDMALLAGSKASHLGGGLSMVEITATLYGAVMRFDPLAPEWPGRDRFILSKGHGVLGYYSALAEAGLLSRDELKTFEQPETQLAGHPIMNRCKGIEFSNGSLGMGLSLGIGVALAGRRRAQDFRVFVLMGDGECNEGSVWEAAMAAAHHQLDRLVAIVDHNGLQQTGSNETIMNGGQLGARWRAFGWEVVELNGHDVGALYDVLSSRNTTSRPLAVIAHTIKGKGFAPAENNNDWHHAVLTQANYEAALAALEEVEVSDA